jgi:hypothetical protein
MSTRLSVVDGKRGIFPHKKFIVYLISKGRSHFEVCAYCNDRHMPAPSTDDFDFLSEEVGEFPKGWKSELKGSGVRFKKWLSKLGVLSAWQGGRDFEDADMFAYKISARQDFEALYLTRGDAKQAREELLIKYSPHFVPSIAAIELYVEYFWNLGSLNYKQILDYIEKNRTAGSRHLTNAVDGDIVGTYARLGLRQKIQEEEFYDNLIAFANQQLLVVRAARPGDLNGSHLMGVSALSRQAMDAISNRRELHASAAPTVDLIKKKAADFFKVKITQRQEIISIDDLNNPDIEEGTDNVRKLKNRG